MGHLLSKEASSLSRDSGGRCRRRGRKVPPRSRSCFLRGPCMLCFVVHGASSPAPEPPVPAGDPLLPPPYAALAAAEQRAARRLLRLPSAAWEPRGRCRRLLLSGLLPSPVRGLLGPAGPPGEAVSEMVCKRKGAGLPACPPCKQPRCAAGAAEPEAAACQCPAEPQPRALPSAAGGAGSGGAAPPRCPAEDEREKEGVKERSGEAGREEPLEQPGDGCREPPPPPDINQLPPSILLKVGRGTGAAFRTAGAGRPRWGCGRPSCPVSRASASSSAAAPRAGTDGARRAPARVPGPGFDEALQFHPVARLCNAPCTRGALRLGCSGTVRLSLSSARSVRVRAGSAEGHAASSRLCSELVLPISPVILNSCSTSVFFNGRCFVYARSCFASSPFCYALVPWLLFCF